MESRNGPNMPFFRHTVPTQTAPLVIWSRLTCLPGRWIPSSVTASSPGMNHGFPSFQRVGKSFGPAAGHPWHQVEARLDFFFWAS